MEQPVLSNLTVQRRDIESGDAITADEAIADAGGAHFQLPEVASIPVADTNIRYTRLFWTLQDGIHEEEPVTAMNTDLPGTTAVCWYRRLNDGVSDAGVLDVFGIDLGSARPVGHVLEGSELSMSSAQESSGAGRRFQTEPVGVTVRARPKLVAPIPETGTASAGASRRQSLRFDHWHVIGDDSGLHINDVTLDVEPGVSALAIAVYRASGAGASLPRREIEAGGGQGVGQHQGLVAWITGRIRSGRRPIGQPE